MKGQTYQGVIREGSIHLSPTVLLPEGQQVYVVVTEQADTPPLMDAHIARRKANGWLVSHIGSVMAQQPHLVQDQDRLIWQFQIFLMIKGQPPQGPFGVIQVDAYSGEILTSSESATKIIAEATARSLSSTN